MVAGDPLGDSGGFAIEVSTGFDEGSLGESCLGGGFSGVCLGVAVIADDHDRMAPGSSPPPLFMKSPAVKLPNCDEGGLDARSEWSLELPAGFLVFPCPDEFDDVVGGSFAVSVPDFGVDPANRAIDREDFF